MFGVLDHHDKESGISEDLGAYAGCVTKICTIFESKWFITFSKLIFDFYTIVPTYTVVEKIFKLLKISDQYHVMFNDF